LSWGWLLLSRRWLGRGSRGFGLARRACRPGLTRRVGLTGGLADRGDGTERNQDGGNQRGNRGNLHYTKSFR